MSIKPRICNYGKLLRTLAHLGNKIEENANSVLDGMDGEHFLDIIKQVERCALMGNRSRPIFRCVSHSWQNKRLPANIRFQLRNLGIHIVYKKYTFSKKNEKHRNGIYPCYKI